MAAMNAMSFEEGWHVLKEAIVRLIHNLELGLSCKNLFTTEEYMRFYTIAYNMAIFDNLDKGKLFDECRKTIEEYTSSKVLPSLRCYENENLLKEFLRRWSNHQILIKWLSRFFPGKITRGSSLSGSIHLAFYGRAYAEIKDQISGAIVTLVDKEREGEEIDKAMVKKVLDIIQEIGEDALEHYDSRIRSAIPLRLSEAETATATATAFYESMMKRLEKEIARVAECSSSPTNNEKLLKAYREIVERVAEALAPPLEEEILEVVRHELLNVHAQELEEMKITSRLKLFHNITNLLLET